MAFDLFGAVAGVFALALAAVYPVLVELSSILVAENLLTALVLGAGVLRPAGAPDPHERERVRLDRRRRGADRSRHAHA